MTSQSLPRVVVLVLTIGMLAGCSLAAAPSLEVAGAYFPAWMLCELVGILGAAGTRVILTTRTLSGVIPFQLAVCTAMGVMVALLSWMVLFR